MKFGGVPVFGKECWMDSRDVYSMMILVSNTEGYDFNLRTHYSHQFPICSLKTIRHGIYNSTYMFRS